MPRGRPANSVPPSQENPPCSKLYDERKQLAERIEKTALVLCEMLNHLQKHGASKELILRAEQGLEFGILAALWSLDYTDEQGNPVQF
jgi:hypothetical protein|nr:MAG TPA: hypothetical protein [Caudoviricetes sp.]